MTKLAMCNGNGLARQVFNAGRTRLKTLDLAEMRKMPKP